MLILSRHCGQIVRIGNDVSITVVEVKGSQVRLGINAPNSVAVHREEVFRRIAEGNPVATAPSEPAALPESPSVRISLKKSRRLPPKT